MIWLNYFDVCVSACIFVSFTVFYCTSCIAIFFLLLILSICLSVCLLFVCLQAMLPDSNKMMMMMLLMISLCTCRSTWPTGRSRSTRQRIPRRTGCYRFSRPVWASRCTWWVTFVVDQLFTCLQISFHVDNVLSFHTLTLTVIALKASKQNSSDNLDKILLHIWVTWLN